VLVIVENNNHSLASTIEERRCPIHVANMCAAVDIPFESLSGNDVFEYLAVLERLRLSVKKSTPVCIEVSLAIFNQHAGPTPGWPTDPKNISIENGLVVEQNPHDPVFVLQQKLGPALFEELTNQVLFEKWKT
jgi:hypothetical protein